MFVFNRSEPTAHFYHLHPKVPDDILMSHNETLKKVPNIDRRMFAGLMVALDQVVFLPRRVFSLCQGIGQHGRLERS